MLIDRSSKIRFKVDSEGGGEKFFVVFEKFLWICKIALNIKSLSNSQKGIKDSFLMRTKIYGKKNKKKRTAFI